MTLLRRLPSAVAAHRASVVTGAVYLAYAIAITWPFALHPTSTLYGLVGLDLTGGIGWSDAFADAGRPPFVPGTIHELNAPEGLAAPWTLELASFPSSLLTWTLAVVVGGVAGSGVFILTNLAGSAFAMFLLARRLTGHAAPAFIAGLAFGFWPYQFAYAAQPLTSGWVLVLACWRALRLLANPTRRNGVWLGASAVLVVSWIQYWILIGGVFLATIAVASLLIGWRQGVLQRICAGWGITAAMLSVWFAMLGAAVLTSSGSAGAAPERDPTDSIRYSARPAMYVIPSPDQPIAGRWTSRPLDRKYSLSGKRPTIATYSPIYLGLSVLLLAALGTITAWPIARDALRRSHDGASGDRLVGAGLVSAAALVPVGLLWSLPPEVRVLGLTIWTPSHVVLWVTTAFRSTARFAEIVMFGLCVLAAFGVMMLVRRRSRSLQAAITAVLALGVAADLWAQEAPGPSRFTNPQIATRLAALPDGILATYPLVPATAWGTDELFYRPVYRKRLFNGYLRGTESESAKIELASPLDPSVPGKLRRWGVRYVIVKWYGRGEAPLGYPERGTPIPGLRPLADGGARTLYEVVAPPARSLVHGLSGLTQPEGDLRRPLRWMNAPEARVQVTADCDPCVGRLVFGTGTFAVARMLTVRDASGHVVASKQIATSGERMSLPLRFSRRTILRFQIDPPPASPRDLDPTSKDTRKLGIFLAQPMRFVAERPPRPTSTRDGTAKGDGNR